MTNLTDYPKQQGISYRTAYLMWQRDELKGRQLSTRITLRDTSIGN